MPKRKNEEKYDKLLKKFKKLEKKIMRQCTRSQSRSRSSSSDNRYPSESQEYAVFDVDNISAEDTMRRTVHDNVPTVLSPAPVHPVLGQPALPTEMARNQDIGGAVSIPSPVAPSASTSTAEPAEPNMTTDLTPNCEELELTGILDRSILEILGDDPTITPTYGPEVHKDLAVRLEHFATQGLPKELRKELKDRYLLPSNCKLIDAPGLNAEIKVAVSEIIAKRDKNIESR